MSEQMDDISTLDTNSGAHVGAQLSAYALGALDPDELERVARHLAACDDCRAALAEYEAVARALPYGAPPRSAPLRARAALLQRIDALGTPNRGRMIILPQPDSPSLAERARHCLRSARRAWIVAVPAALLVIALGANQLFMQNRLDQQQNQIQSAESAKSRAVDTLLVDYSLRYMTELSGANASPEAVGRLFVDRESNAAMLVAKYLRQPGDGQVYVAWLHGNGAYESVGALELDETGRCQLIISPDNTIDSYDSLVVTLERDPAVASPSGPAVLTGTLVPQGGQVEQRALLPR